MSAKTKQLETATSLRFGVIGVGKIGETIAKGLLHSLSSAKVSGSTHTEESAEEIRKNLGFDCMTDNKKLVEASDILILAVKPHQAENLLKQIAPFLTSRHLLISVVASITLEQLKKYSGGKCRILRAMPNLPCVLGSGMTVISKTDLASEEDCHLALSIFKLMGRALVLEEFYFDAVTGLSACGPAFVFLIIESLAEAGVKVGLSRDVSIELAAQTVMGSARMVLEEKKHPAALKDEVTTPAGCTIDGLMALEEGGLRATLIRAVVASAQRSASLRNP